METLVLLFVFYKIYKYCERDLDRRCFKKTGMTYDEYREKIDKQNEEIDRYIDAYKSRRKRK